MLAALSSSAIVPNVRRRWPQIVYTGGLASGNTTRRQPIIDFTELGGHVNSALDIMPPTVLFGTAYPTRNPRFYFGSPGKIAGFIDSSITNTFGIGYGTGYTANTGGYISLATGSVSFDTLQGNTTASLTSSGLRLLINGYGTCGGGLRYGGSAYHMTVFAGDVTGTNTAAGTLKLAPGASTGNATPGSVIIQGTSAGSSGSTAQTLFDIVTVAGANPNVAITAGAATHVPLVVRGAASQSANLMEWRNSAGTIQTAIDASGRNFVLDTTTGTQWGTANNQKQSFWGVTPVVQPAGASQAALTDSTGGTPGSAINDVGASFSQTTLNNNFATLLNLVSAMRTALVSSGLIKGSA